MVADTFISLEIDSTFSIECSKNKTNFCVSYDENSALITKNHNEHVFDSIKWPIHKLHLNLLTEIKSGGNKRYNENVMSNGMSTTLVISYLYIKICLLRVMTGYCVSSIHSFHKLVIRFYCFRELIFNPPKKNIVWFSYKWNANHLKPNHTLTNLICFYFFFFR